MLELKSVAIIFLVLLSGCLKKAQQPIPSSENTIEEKVEDWKGLPLEDRVVASFRVANDRVESARILSAPFEPLPETKLQGIALPLYPELPSISWKDKLRWIADSGANTVSIVISWDQRTIFHNRVAPDEDTAPTDAQVEEVILLANKLGLKVLIFPILHVRLRNDGEWRGKLAPTKPVRWKESYRDYIRHYAKMSERTGAFALSVGSELSSLEKDEVFWEGLISEVRSIYKGKLTYSANWDHYTHPKFWDKLDYIGISSYFEVAKRNDEPIHVVTQRWITHKKEIVAFANTQNKPFILTEVGYPSIDSAATKPWDYTAKTAPNQNAQMAALRSLVDAWGTEESDAFAGLFLWHGWGAGGVNDLSYSFWRKTSLGLVKNWYGGKVNLPTKDSTK